MSYQSRKTQAIINLTALKHNYQQIAALAPKSMTIAVIKANAYGHGMVEVAKAIDSIVPALAVAFIDEALKLRGAGIDSPILILEGPLDEKDLAIANENNFWLMLHNHQQLQWLTQYPHLYSEKLWLKINTGMNRLGFSADDVSQTINTLSEKQQQNLVLCSHFSSAEELENPKTQDQINTLKSIAKQYQCAFSLANSAGIINWPASHGDFNRVGIALYGSFAIPQTKVAVPLMPVMTLQSSVIAIRTVNIGDCVGYGEAWQAQRTSRIATIAIGYADGYFRNAKAGTPVWINGQVAFLAGCVSMDMITVDVTDLTDVKIADPVELWGENLAVEEIANRMGTINYEVLTRVSERVPRIYIEKKPSA